MDFLKFGTLGICISIINNPINITYVRLHNNNLIMAVDINKVEWNDIQVETE